MVRKVSNGLGFTISAFSFFRPQNERIVQALSQPKGSLVVYDPESTTLAAPPAAGNDGKLLLDGPTSRFHSATTTTTTTMRSCMIRLLGMWQPEGTPEFDQADILQAVFLKAEVVPVREEM